MLLRWGVMVLVLVAAISRARSSDLLDRWVAATSGTEEMLRAVAYAQDQWIAVGNQSTILASTNGITWETRVVTPTNLTVLGVAGGPGGWVATADASLLRSEDGRTWVHQALPTGVAFVQVAHGDGVWMATGRMATGNQVGEPAVFRSTNGIVWEPTLSLASLVDPLHGVTGNRFSAIAYGQGQWIALSVYSDRLNTRSTVHLSSDGRGWSRATGSGSGSFADAPFATLSSAARGTDGWRAVGTGRESRSVTIASPDGISWQIAQEPPAAALNHLIAWGGGTWLRLARVGGWELYTLEEAKPEAGWVRRTPNLSLDGYYNAVSFGQDRWVIVGSNGRIYCSGFPPSLAVRLDGSSARIVGSITGVPGAKYEIQASEDLVHWESLEGATAVPAGESFEDTATSGTSRRFYRAMAP